MATTTVEEKNNIARNTTDEVVDQALLTDTSVKPSLGVNEDVSNTAAEEEAADQDAKDFGTVNAAEQEIISTAPPAEAQPEARENTPVEMHADVASAGVTAVQPNHEIPAEHQIAEIVSPHTVDGKGIQYTEKSQEGFPPLFESGQYGNGQGAPLNALEKFKNSVLRFARKK